LYREREADEHPLIRECAGHADEVLREGES
jgi:hypothetical protein